MKKSIKEIMDQMEKRGAEDAARDVMFNECRNHSAVSWRGVMRNSEGRRYSIYGRKYVNAHFFEKYMEAYDAEYDRQLAILGRKSKAIPCPYFA